MVTRACRIALTCLVVLALLTSCGGGEDGRETGGGSQSPVLTLTDTACTFAGPREMRPGELSIDVQNDSSLAGGFELLRLAENASADELAAHVEEQQERIAEGLAPVVTPSIATRLDRVPVVARWGSTLAADVTAGTYGLVCFIGPPPKAMYFAAAVEVAK